MFAFNANCEWASILEILAIPIGNARSQQCERAITSWGVRGARSFTPMIALRSQPA